MLDQKKTVLISTLYTQAHGGVYTMLSFLVHVLQEMGLLIKIAYYIPYSVKPELSVPIKNLFQKKTGCIHFVGNLDVEEYAIGTYLPELEFLNYYPNQHWKKLIDNASLHIVITGHILAALPFYISNKKYLVWVASPYYEDRKDRIKLFPWYRKLIDFLFISKISSQLEKKLLMKGIVFSLSYYAKQAFNKNAQYIRDIIPMSINTQKFFPANEKTQYGLICFAGRFLDPRKNIDFLFNIFSLVLKKIKHARLCLIGDEVTPELLKKLDILNIATKTVVLDYISDKDFVLQLQQTDVFVIASYQEGLCIAGLEAMACGCPVVSTKCGGPNDYIIDGKNGYLVDFNTVEFANKIIQIIENRGLRNDMSAQALDIVQKNYNDENVKNKWVNIIQKEFLTC